MNNLLLAYQPLFDLFLLSCGLAFSQYVVLRAGVFSIATVGIASLGAYTATILTMHYGLGLALTLPAATFIGLAAGLAGRPEGHQRGVVQDQFPARGATEEFGILRVGAGPPAFHIVDADAVERQGDGVLVLHAEIDALRLRPVAQRGIEEVEAFAGHGLAPRCEPLPPSLPSPSRGEGRFLSTPSQ